MKKEYESLGELAEKAAALNGSAWVNAQMLMQVEGTGLYEQDAELIAGTSPSAILSLLADMKVMQEALESAEEFLSPGAWGSDENKADAWREIRAALQRVKGES